MGMVRKFGVDAKAASGSYAAGVRLGQKKTAKWLHRKSGGRCMTGDADDLGEAEGGKARQHLGRPGRKHGGKAVAKHDNDHDEDDGYASGGFLKGIKKGALRAEMGVKSGDKIPAKKLDKATHSSNPLLKKRAVLAQNMKSWNHK